MSSDRAIYVNIQIMRVFTKIGKVLSDNTELRLAVEEIKKKLKIILKISNLFFNISMNWLSKNRIPRIGR